MKTESRDPLLETVLEDEEIFRAAMLRQTLALARRRRRGRAVRRTLGVAGVLIVAAAWLRRETPPPPAPQLLATAAPPVRIIHSAPLASSEVVSTRRGLFTSIASAPAGIKVVGSRADAFAIVETHTGAPVLNHLDDQQLLAVFHDAHPALIAPGTAEARLVFY